MLISAKNDAADLLIYLFISTKRCATTISLCGQIVPTGTAVVFTRARHPTLSYLKRHYKLPTTHFLCSNRTRTTSSSTSFHCPLKYLLFNAFVSTLDVAKVAQLSLSYCVSKDEWGGDLLQHPVFGSFILPGYPEKSSVAPQLKGLDPFVVFFCWCQLPTAVCGNRKHSKFALRNLSLRSINKPLLFHMLSIF